MDREGGAATSRDGRHVQEAHKRARLCFQQWCLFDKPMSGPLYEEMCSSRKTFKSKLKFCQNHKDQVKMDIIASHHKSKNFDQFWKATNKLNPKMSLPASVENVSEPSGIADLFMNHFKVDPLPVDSGVPVRDDESCVNVKPIRVTAAEVAKAIRQMERGKSPGNDGLSIEHLRYAGVHLPRVLAMFYTFCIRHSYLPDDLMRTIVVPIVKCKTGDASDKCNY